MSQKMSTSIRRRNRQSWMGRAALCGVAGALAALSTSSAYASTVSLASGDAGYGLDLNPANVLVASGPVGATSFLSLSTATDTIQGVTFDLPSNSGGYVANNGVTVSIGTSSGSLNHLAYNASDGYLYYTTTSNVNNGSSNNSTTANPQPTDTVSNNLEDLVKTDVNYTGGEADSLVITISGLTVGQTYDLDLIQSNTCYAQRDQSIYFNNSPTATENNYLWSSSSSSGSAYIYDSNDDVTAVGAGVITVTITSTTSGQPPVINGVVVSSVTPEPATLGLMSVASLGLLARRRRAMMRA